MRVERVVPILRGERRRASNSDVRLNKGLLEDLGESRNEVLRGRTFCGDKRVRFSMMGVLRMGMCVCVVEGICVRSILGTHKSGGAGDWRAIIAEPQTRRVVTE
jgi:hypothetical protein